MWQSAQPIGATGVDALAPNLELGMLRLENFRAGLLVLVVEEAGYPTQSELQTPAPLRESQCLDCLTKGRFSQRIGLFQPLWVSIGISHCSSSFN